MSDSVALELLNDEEWVDSLDTDEVKAAIEGNLVPKGKWSGQVQLDSKIEVVETADGDHAFEGKKMARVHVIVSAGDDGEKHYFFDACPSVVKAVSRKGGSYTPEASTNAGFLYKATKLYGQPFPAVLRAACEKRFIYDIGIRKATDEYPARNTLKGIYMEKEEDNG